MNSISTNLSFPVRFISTEEATKIADTMGPRAAGSAITVAEDGSTIATVLKSSEEWAKDSLAAEAIHGSGAYLQAGDAIGAMTKRIDAVNTSVSAQLHLKSTDWDFTMKDGKFVVNGRKLSSEDTQFIEDKLNGDKALVGAVQSFIGAEVKNLQTADDNIGGITSNIYTGGMRDLTFDNVEDQLNGKLDFKAFLAKTEDLATVHGQLDEINDAHRGYTSLQYFGTQLDSNYKPIGYQVFPTAGHL